MFAFDLEREFVAAKTVAKRLEGDFATRIIACLLTAGVIAWSGLVGIALVWMFFVLLNEAVEPAVVRRLQNSETASQKTLFIYAGHIASGSAVWAGAGVALWITNDPAVMTLGAVLMLGTLMHVSLIYSISRLLVSAVSAPLILAMAVMAILVLADDAFPLRDKALVIFSVAILLAYLMMLLLTNIETQDEMAKLANENARYAREDALTQLSNRRHFVEKVQALQARDQAFALAFIDLDRFKPLNDEHGHAVGDEALIAVSNRLKAAEGIAFTARLGGDEFGVLICDAAALERLEEILNQAWTDVTRPFQTSIGPIDLGASIGCARTTETLSDHSKLMHAADVAMLRAKVNGGGVAQFDPDLDLGMFEAAGIERAFRAAVRDDHIRAALQPIKCVRTQMIKKCELLARWVRTDGGKSLSPNEFIPLAERLGLLNQILWNTLDQALPTIRGRDLTLAINISPSQLLSSDFFVKLDTILRRHLVVPAQIELEITEQVALRNDAENLNHLVTASEAGYAIVLDDFGTGYSSISLLEKLPLTKVKLDHVFVRDAVQTTQGKKLLAAIIGLLNQMNLKSCVEGVETTDIETFVTARGCAEVQGYLIGRPQVLINSSSDQCVDHLKRA
ncbi:MAG: EAL domain-containing protein [Pseudomonadota bacterium]